VYQEIAIRDDCSILRDAIRLAKKVFIIVGRHPFKDVGEIEFRDARIRKSREVPLAAISHNLDLLKILPDDVEVFTPEIWRQMDFVVKAAKQYV